MTQPLRVLFVEDCEDDTLLVLRELRTGSFAVKHKRVDTPEGLTLALEQQPWDVIISDFSMPRFSGLAALQMVRGRGLDTPFIFVSGTIGEDVAVAALKNGANDYVVKGSLGRLVPAIHRELREAEGQRARRRAEQALQESQERLAGILDTAEDAVISVNENQCITLFNKGAERIFGYTVAEVIDKPLDLLLPARFVAAHRQHLRDFAKTSNAARNMAMRQEVFGRRKDGTEFPAEASISNFVLDGRIIFTAFVRDVTERKTLETHLRQAQKMEAVGQLAGGVAHDFNNLLTIISGFSEILLASLPPEDPNRELIQQIHKAGQRAAGLTRQLLAFSRKSVLEPKVLDLNAIITDTEKMLKRLIGEDVILTTVLDPGLKRVKVDAGQMEQVIMNLAVNARDAMPRGGQLTIETKNIWLDDSYEATHPEVKSGAYVLLAVSDTGCGMTPEVQARVFEPFFTTKDPGKGTGLGLAMVYGIIQESNGVIYVYSEVNRGTTFKMYLPVAREAAPTAKSWHGVKLTAQGTETILLVEDEDAVRSVARLALQHAGYSIVEASRGAEAIRHFEQHPGPIDLLITDVVMPEMGGRQLVERLTQLQPALKVLYLSGYADDAVVRHGVLQANVAFLQKPFTMTSLTSKVRDVLDADT